MRQCPHESLSSAREFIMVSKILAAVLAVGVLSVGGYTYWKYADGHCCGSNPQTTPISTPTETVPPCCQEPSRTSCFGLPQEVNCCGEADVPAAAEVLTVQPREVK
jgi:hypothetical protein